MIGNSLLPLAAMRASTSRRIAIMTMILQPDIFLEKASLRATVAAVLLRATVAEDRPKMKPVQRQAEET